MTNERTFRGRYQVISTLGKGGFATVYRARDLSLNREVALKVLLPHLAEEPEIRQRFLIEAQAMAQLSHPNIVTIFDVGEDNGQPFYVMELIAGQSLADVLAPGRPFDLQHAVMLVGSLAAGVDYLHQAGIVHRDIKPANVMLESSGRVLLMDFGIARVE